MAQLTIKGRKTYIDKMFKHLRKEHPSTRTRMTEILKRGAKR